MGQAERLGEEETEISAVGGKLLSSSGKDLQAAARSCCCGLFGRRRILTSFTGCVRRTIEDAWFCGFRKCRDKIKAALDISGLLTGDLGCSLAHYYHTYHSLILRILDYAYYNINNKSPRDIPKSYFLF